MYEITEDQRKVFLEILKDAQRKYERDYDDYFSALKGSFTPKVEANQRAKGFMESLRHYREKMSEAIAGLRQLGFRVDDGMISVDLATSYDVRHEIDAAREAAKEKHQEHLSTFRKALLDLASVSTVEQAKKIAEQFT